MSMQQTTSIKGNDLTAFRHKYGWQFSVLGGGLMLLLAGGYFYLSLSNMSETGQVAARNEFRIFWAAARIALEAPAVSVFDTTLLGSKHGIATDAWVPWLYPPGFLMLVTPFGALPFGAAWAVFSVISIIAIVLAMRPFTRHAVPLWLACSFAPAYLPVLMVGQNSLIWLAGLMAVFWALREEKHVIAGIFIGLLTLKPQLGLMIPFALLAIGAWRTIFAAILTTVLVSGIPTLFYGVEYWSELHEVMVKQGTMVTAQIAELSFMLSAFSLLMKFGVPTELALSIQWGMAAISAGIVFWVWKQPSASWDLKAAVLLCSTALAAPYFWHYESIVLVPIGLFMLRAGILRLKMPDYGLLILLWIGISPIMYMLFLNVENVPAPRMFFVPLVIVCMMVCVRAALQSRKAHPLTS